jgi:multiple sugar transport system substrate-binding protein
MLTRRAVILGLAGLGLAAAAGGSLLLRDNSATPTPAPAQGISVPPTTVATSSPPATPLAPNTPTMAAPTATNTPVPTPSPTPVRTPTPFPATISASIPRTKSTATITGQRYYLYPSQDFHPDHNAFIRLEVMEYCKVHGWNCDMSYGSGIGDLLTAFIAAVQAGTPPDAFYHDISVSQYHHSGVLEPVTDLVTDLSAKYGTFLTGFEQTTLINGAWWGVPFYGRAGGLYARRDLFAQHGLDVDRDTETYDKLREAALRITDPGKQKWGWGLSLGRNTDGNTTVQQALLRYGSQLQDASGQLVTFHSPETTAGLRWLQETYADPAWSNMFPPGFSSWSAPSNNEVFLAGTLAITDNAGTMYAKAVFDKLPIAKDIALLPRPKRVTDGQRLDALAGVRLHIPKGAKNRAASYDIFRHLLSEPFQRILLQISPGYVLPPYRKLWSDPLVQTNDNARRAEALAYPNHPFTGLRHPCPASPARRGEDVTR